MFNSNIIPIFNKNIFPIGIFILFIIYFYKLYFQYSIPISGDELNSILVYSSNIKTLFLKNFPHNAVFFHLIGYIKSIIFGFNLNSFRIITFIFVILHILIIKKFDFDELKMSIFFSLLLLSNFSLYGGIYVGYIFSSSIFVYLYYLIINNKNEKNNKLIFFLLFIQLYNHLVNIYLVLPILIVLFIFSKKKKFIKNSIVFFGIPLISLYFFSILLTGLSSLKISDISFSGTLSIFINNYNEIIISGFKGIFFYEGISQVEKFNSGEFFYNLFNYDKFIFGFIILSFITAIINFIKKEFLILSSIIILHFLLFYIFNKQPPPRIFTGYFCFYVVFNFTLINRLNYKKYISYIKIISLLVLLILIVKFNFSKFIQNGVYAEDITYQENELSLKILKEKGCILKNENFSEIQKRNFYFNYLNFCKNKFSLNEFLIFYRS